VDCITLCLIERQQLTSSTSTKTHEKVIYQTQVMNFLPVYTRLSYSGLSFTSPAGAVERGNVSRRCQGARAVPVQHSRSEGKFFNFGGKIAAYQLLFRV
jgi:hypothetical protein